MRILQLLAEKELSIHKKWLDQILNEFQPEAVPFLKNKDPFANPLGHSFSDGLRTILRDLRSDEPTGVEPVVEHLMKLRAVQTELAPSAALAFLFALKKIVREECRKEWTPEIEEEWLDVAQRIDRLILAGFDFYMASRERLFKIRLQELQSGRHIITDQSKCSAAIVRENLKGK